jgi:hypothetical protein
MDETKPYRLVRNLQVGDRVYLGQDYPVQLTEVEHLGGGLTVLRGSGGFQVRKDSHEAVFVA